MKIKYHKETDVLYVSLNNLPVCESDEDKPGVIIDYSQEGKIVGIEVLQASKLTSQPLKLEYEVV